ncbi:MAG: 2-C-methyl-D-erythritol 2,4-cyclodiphosphate synthase [Bacteroidetes bacterium]|nr:2-C-methyl-D-erythritol 2,4-cyclodiphosphate synthase [Bacteroidota bacterium]MCL5268571.1 2-C-methyl-D-erythritol 2,4-cyclodiphosphate synthase [Bacteroidota bacterium]
MRIGFGFDAHVLVEGKVLKLGGEVIDFPRGLRGHSDGDIVLHSLSDAILGACAQGDIGMYFRDDDKKIEGIDSKRILAFALEAASKSRMKIVNIDIVIVADEPKLSGLYNRIQTSISQQCNVPAAAVSVKAKTTEGTLVGNDSMACFAVVLMEQS